MSIFHFFFTCCFFGDFRGFFLFLFFLFCFKSLREHPPQLFCYLWINLVTEVFQKILEFKITLLTAYCVQICNKLITINLGLFNFIHLLGTFLDWHNFSSAIVKSSLASPTDLIIPLSIAIQFSFLSIAYCSSLACACLTMIHYV